MAYTYDPTTDAGQVRLALGDASGTDGDATTYVFEDAEIDAFLGVLPEVVEGLRRMSPFKVGG